MATRMLIDAAHPEETRVVVVRGTRLEEFDFESATKRQLKGNIYLAKVTRVEPSLQAAFVDYGGNRHGFLPFNEIHPDYYQIPIADRESLLKQEAIESRAEAEEEEADVELLSVAGDDGEEAPDLDPDAADDDDENGDESEDEVEAAGEPDADASQGEDGAELSAEASTEIAPENAENGDIGEIGAADDDDDEPRKARGKNVEAVGGDELDEVVQRRRRPNRRYKIQEVIKRRQILLVQVVKEERGNKGAALTTYLSLAGRYCVLMPNTARGGGVSRKITSQTDRKKLKSIIDDLAVPEGMGLIVRTAGQERSKAEIKRDYEYLLRLWDSVRELTLSSTAPALTYEEANLIKRSIRDLYTKEIDEILVEGDAGYRAAKDFMKMLMPSHAKRVQPYIDRIPLFHRYQVEQQFDSMHSPTVQLKSGGYIVINPTEALVAIDVNSGRATKERNIEETAYRTNLEAAEEVARQLRLRDLAGLIVIDFIDMDESRNARNVERRIKEKLKSDRARIQVGRISAFGLLEMSRQRLRPSLLEASTEICVHCEGSGVVRSVESSALHVLRAIEEEGIRGRAAEILTYVATPVAIYLLNQKRAGVLALEERFDMKIAIAADQALVPPDYSLERVLTRADAPDDDDTVVSDIPAPIVQDNAHTDDGTGEDEEPQAKKRRRRGKRGGRRRRSASSEETAEQTTVAGEEAPAEVTEGEAPAPAPAPSEQPAAEGEAVAAKGEEKAPRKRRRRSRRRSSPSETPAAEAEATEQTEQSEVLAEAPAEPEAQSPEAQPEVAPAEAPEETPAEAIAETPVEAVIEMPDLSAPAMEEAEMPLTAGPAAETIVETPGEVIVAEPIVAQPADAVAVVGEPDDAETGAGDDEDKPRRRGWWQRG